MYTVFVHTCILHILMINLIYSVLDLNKLHRTRLTTPTKKNNRFFLFLYLRLFFPELNFFLRLSLFCQ